MEQYLPINGSDIFVKIIGEGEPIIFLHGGPGSEHGFFLPHMERLADDYKLVFYDQRGCGLSQAVDRYTIEDEIETLEQLRKLLGLETVNFFGESWGSMLALSYATKYPKNVNRIFLTAAIGITADALTVFEKELEQRISDEDKAILFIIDEKLKKGEASTEEIFDILDPYYVYSTANLSGKSRIDNIVNEKLSKDIRFHYDLRSELSTLSTIPIMVAQGDYDIISPELINSLLVDHIPHATLHNIEKCGHWTVVEQPNVIAKLLREHIGVIR